MTRGEHARLMAEHGITGGDADIIWEICGRGLTISLASHWHRGTVGSDQYRGLRRRIQRRLRQIGWSAGDGPG